jgi:imidazoleglycerol-phosphate dehydratase
MPRKIAAGTAERRGQVSRTTKETQISVELFLDGSGKYDVNVGNGFFKHMLEQLAKHGLMDLKLTATGDVEVGWHHIVEDTGIALGRALRQAVGEGRGIVRTAHAYAPLDEALALTVVDLSGRGYAVVDTGLTQDDDLGGLPADLIRHFLESLAREGGVTLHVRMLAGVNGHHKAEAIFKSLGRAIRAAAKIDGRAAGDIPSTKGTIHG